MKTSLPKVIALTACLLPFIATAEQEPPPRPPENAEERARFDQSSVPIEVEPTDPSLAKIVLVAGPASHGSGDHEYFAGCALLMKLLQQTPGVFPVLVRDNWPKNEKVFAGARAIVFYLDGSGNHPMMDPAKRAVIRREIEHGCGYVNLHYALEYTPEVAKEVLPWIGGYYEPGVTVNPRWTATFESLPEHPVTRGVKPFQIHDEWYYNITWLPDMKGITLVLQARPSDKTRSTPDTQKHLGRNETLAWVFEREDGGRSFGFTGGHIHRNWGDESFRRLVVNGILWSAHVEVPPNGAKVDLATGDLDVNLDLKERRPKPIPPEFQVKAKSRPITDWLFVGPFPNGKNTGFDTVFPPESEALPKFTKFYTGKGGDMVEWREIATDPAGTASTYVLLGKDQEQTVSYFWTMIYAPHRQPINLGIGSDDGVKVWLNGSVIHANNIGRGLTTDEDAAWGMLEPGPNQLLVKLVNAGGLGGLIVTVKSEGITLKLPTVP